MAFGDNIVDEAALVEALKKKLNLPSDVQAWLGGLIKRTVRETLDEYEIQTTTKFVRKVP